MGNSKKPTSPESKRLSSTELKRVVSRLESCIDDVEALQAAKPSYDDPRIKPLEQKIARIIGNVYGTDSLEFRDHQYFELRHGPKRMQMSRQEHQSQLVDGIPRALATLRSLLTEAQEQLELEDDTDSQQPVGHGARGGAGLKDIFISHASGEVAFVEALIELLKGALGLRSADIMCTSVPGYGFNGGEKFGEQLAHAARDSRVVIGVVSPASLRSTYTMFEQGARWGSGQDLVVLLPSGGLSKSDVKAPLSEAHILSAAQETDILSLVERVSKSLKRSQEPSAAWHKYIQRMKDVQATPEPIPLTWMATYGVGANAERLAHGRPIEVSDIRGVLKESQSSPLDQDPKIAFRMQLNIYLTRQLPSMRGNHSVQGSKVDEASLELAWECVLPR